MRIHPAAEVFPLLTGAEMAALIEDVRARGLIEPIWRTADGAVLDGRNRLAACEAAGVEPRFREYEGDDPVRFVVSVNLRRRHLDESQRSIVAARIATLPAHRPRSASIDALPQDEAAVLLNVSRSGVQRGREVLDHGAPELVAAVERGEVAVSTASALASLSEEEQAAVVARGEREILARAKEIRAARSEERRGERMEKLAAISMGNAPLDGSIGRFPVVLGDPPWRYQHSETESRAIENQYPTMSHEEICCLDVDSVTTDDAVLFLWTTFPKLEEAISAINAWGFRYVSGAIWDKQRTGMGYYFRIDSELLLVATKGEPPTPAPADRPSNVIRVPRGEHSEKPVVVYEMIERMYPLLPKLELFCRSPRDGWRAWGNQS